MKKKILNLVTILCLIIGLTGCSAQAASNYVSEIPEAISDAIDYQVARATIGVPHEAPACSNDKYAYGTLNDEERLVYNQILDAIRNRTDDVPLSTKSVDVVKRVYNCVLADYGDLFWISGYEYQVYYRRNHPIGVTFSASFYMTPETQAKYQSDIDAVVAQWLSEAPTDGSDYAKAKYVYERLITNVDYDIDSPNNQNIISVFLGGATVCQGYADAVNVLLQAMGVQSVIVTGEANNESHAWNMVRLDGDYYYMDVTWGNSRYLNADATEGNMINYAYLNVTSEEIAQTHRNQVVFELPDCTAVKCNYYNQEQRYFTEWDIDAIGTVFTEAYEGGSDIVSVKFAGNELYQQALDYFLTQGRFVDYCPGLRSMGYIESQEMSVLTFMF